MVSGAGNYLGAMVRINFDENVDGIKLAAEHMNNLEMCELIRALRLWLGFNHFPECTWFAGRVQIIVDPMPPFLRPPQLVAAIIFGNLQPLAEE